jgi:hypothetical protein
MKRWLTGNQLTGPPERTHGESGLLLGSGGSRVAWVWIMGLSLGFNGFQVSMGSWVNELAGNRCWIRRKTRWKSLLGDRVFHTVQRVMGRVARVLFRVSRIGGCTGSTGRWLTGDRIAGVLWPRRRHPSEDRTPSPSTLPISSLSLSISRSPSQSLISHSLASLSHSISLTLSIAVSVGRSAEERRRRRNEEVRRKGEEE